MIGSTNRILLASFGLLTICLGAAEAQQRSVIVHGDQGSAGVFVSGGGVGSAMVSDRGGMQEGIVVDSEGRVRRFRQNATAGNAIGAFSGQGSGGVVTGDFDPFNFVFGQRGFPGPRFAAPHTRSDFIDISAIEATYLRGDFALALRKAEDADRLFPGDPDIQQLRALALFALGRYPEAGHAVRDALDSGLIWTWTALRRLYDSDEDYLEHYRALHLAATTQPDSADTLILLAYHDLMLGRLDAARQSIQNALAARPDDPVARALIANLPPDPVVLGQ